jgi:DNA-binding beta-propeller fold protein YncE
MNLFTRWYMMPVLFTALCIYGFSEYGNAQTPSNQNSGTSGYHLIKKINLGGSGGWDCLYVDSDARRLYVSRSTHVAVVDVDSGKVIGDIPNTNGVHGIAIASEFGSGFTSNGRDSSVTIFDLKTLQQIGSVKVEKNPDEIIYDLATKRVFAFNRGSSSASAIDAKTGSIAGTIALGGHPEFAVADGNGMIYINIDDKSEIVALDSRKLEVKSRWPLAPGESPSGIALDQQHRRLFSACENKKMIILNADNGQVISTLPIGEGTDGAGFDPETQLAFSSNGEGTLSIIHEDSADKFSVIESIPTQRGARTMAIDAKTHNIFLVTAQFGPAPEPTPERPHPRPSIIPDTFVILVFGK